MYSFFSGDFPDVKFFASRHSIHVVEEGPEECLFDPAEVPACERAVMQPIHGTETENRIGGSDEEGNLHVLPSG